MSVASAEGMYLPPVAASPPPDDVPSPAGATTLPAPIEAPANPGSGRVNPELDRDDVATNVARALTDTEERGFVGTIIVQTPQGEWTTGLGLADRAAGAKNEAGTIFDIGSITKQFTAAAILRLEMDGHLSVDDTIGQYVEGLNPQQREITLHQLLTHTSGLPHSVGADDEVIALPGYIARIAKTFHSTPGDYLYSNVGYSLLAAAIENVTGGSYELYLREALFEPAGLTHTGYRLPDWAQTTVAVGYIGEQVFGRPDEQSWGVDGPWWNLRGNGGLLSSMPDLLSWDAALSRNEILDETAKQKMYTPHVALEDGAFYGYGWVVVPLADGSTLITHGGSNDIFFADFWRFVDHDVTIVLATNVADPAFFDLGMELASEIFATDLFGICEINQSIEQAADFDRVADFPDTAQGQAMAAFVSLLLPDLSGDPDSDTLVRTYVEQSIGHGFIAELGVDELVGLIISLQELFAGFGIDRIYQEDAATFHVAVVDSQGMQQLISAGIGPAPESRIECTGFAPS